MWNITDVATDENYPIKRYEIPTMKRNTIQIGIISEK